MEPDFLSEEELHLLRRAAGPPLDRLAMAAMANLWRASTSFKVRMEREVLRAHGLTFGSYSTLFRVWVHGPIETRNLAESQGVTRATVSSTVALLEREGLVRRRRDGSDRRLVRVELTPRGRAMIERLFPEFNRAEKAVVSVLSGSEQETLTRLLRKLLGHLREGPVPALAAGAAHG